MAAFEARIGRRTLGNKAASGTAIIDELGPEHMRTGAPIVYTSADSVFQIAAHEDVVPVPELYRMCEIAFDLVGIGHGVGRVIARPFVGAPGSFQRTSNRRDFALTPFAPTLLDLLTAAGTPVVAIGKIEDLFAGRGMSRAVHTTSDANGMDEVERAIDATPRGLIFVNLVDFDTVYGHRNDAEGYAANLERFDARLSALLPQDRRRRSARHHRRPRQRSDDAEHRPLARARAAARVRTVRARRRRSGHAPDLRRILDRRLAELFGVGPLEHGTSFLGHNDIDGSCSMTALGSGILVRRSEFVVLRSLIVASMHRGTSTDYESRGSTRLESPSCVARAASCEPER